MLMLRHGMIKSSITSFIKSTPVTITMILSYLTVTELASSSGHAGNAGR